MNGVDMVKNRINGLTGFAKARIGGLTGNKQMRAKGKNAQSKSNLKQAGEKLKKAFK